MRRQDRHCQRADPLITQLPIAVDLDGTLIRADMLHESALRVLRDRPLQTLLIPVWAASGKAVLKQRLAGRTTFDPSALPYHAPLVAWLQEQRLAGRRLVLCTATDRSIADAIAAHLGFFDEVMASDGTTNLSGENKAEALERRFGSKGFDYVGNERKDLAVWRRAHAAIVVGSQALADAATGVCDIAKVFPPERVGVHTWRRVLRVHQWMKNLLLFVPLFASHQITNAPAVQGLLLAFLAFSLCASSVYIANDLLDLDSDRQHVRKRNRPFASGLVPVWLGIALAPLLLSAAFVIAHFCSPSFVNWLIFYFTLTCAYSWSLKRLVLIDCLTLAMLYTVRIVAGAAAVDMPLSFWLLAFAVFLFLSLAFIKRYAEMEVKKDDGPGKVHGRGYYASDAPLIQALGITAGYAAVLVLALYLNTDTVVELYRAPQVIWGTVPVMLFWISWLWLKAHRGEMHDDPMVFAVRDRTSLLSGIAFAAVLFVGTVGMPW